MSARRAPGIPLVAGIVALALAASAVALEYRAGTAARERAAELRALRVELQRVERARASLEREPDRARVLEASPDEVRVAILEAVESLAGSHRVALRGHALRPVTADPYAVGTEADIATGAHVLRLSLELEAVHAVRLIEALTVLADASPGRPVDLVGCRVDRAPVGAEGATDAGERAEPLLASCALDWHWWPS